MKKLLVMSGIAAGVIAIVSGCGSVGEGTGETVVEAEIIATTEDSVEENSQSTDEDETGITTETGVSDEHVMSADADMTAEPVESADSNISETPEILDFVDVFQEHYQVEIKPDVKKHDYILDSFVHDGNLLYYQNDDRYDYELGIDVSYHNGNIDWQKVKESGIEFVIIRAAYRGYGKAGNLNKDKCFEKYIEGAHNAGLKVGVYIFSQAINEEEAKEEAEFVLDIIKDHKLELPVVYDPESILDDVARTDDVSGEQFTRNTVVFCRMIEEAGYQPMIYSNMLWEAFELDLSELSDYPIWYADYELLPQTPYAFEYWQYTNEGKIAGVPGNVDINIRLLPR